MAKVVLENISKMFGNVEAVKNFDLTVEDKEFVILVGPSGCGKSTALRMVAGLEEPTTGTIYIGDRAVNDLPPKDRDIAMVFQEYALYPHMSVYKNMAFALKLRKFPKEEIDQRVTMGLGDPGDSESSRPEAEAAFRRTASEGRRGKGHCPQASRFSLR